MNKTCHFAIEKETKGTVRYKEVNADGTDTDMPVFGTVYIKKYALAGNRPQRLTITVSDE